jgi:hypothetical protein
MKLDLIREVSFRSCEPVIEQLEPKTNKFPKRLKGYETYKVGWPKPVVYNVRQEPHRVLHPKAELLDVLPLLGFLPIVQKNVGLGRIGESPDADPIGAPVLHRLVGPRLDAADELLDDLEGPPWRRNKSTREGNRPSSSTVF